MMVTTLCAVLPVVVIWWGYMIERELARFEDEKFGDQMQAMRVRHNRAHAAVRARYSAQLAHADRVLLRSQCAQQQALEFARLSATQEPSGVRTCQGLGQSLKVGEA